MLEPRGRVLVVDDSPTIRELIRVNLELEGFHVDLAVDGQDALEQVRDKAPDVVTLDVVMPRMDGFEAAERLRGDSTTSGVRIVMVTAAAQAADLRRGEQIGVDAFLTKPFEPGELVRVVRRLANLAR